MNYKNYKIKTSKGGEYYLLARNNRDAMKLAGRLVKWCGDILWLKDEFGSIIFYNKHLRIF